MQSKTNLRRTKYLVFLTICVGIIFVLSPNLSHSLSEKIYQTADYWSTESISFRLQTTTGLSNLLDNFTESQPYLAKNHPIQHAYLGSLYAYLIEKNHPKAMKLLDEGIALATSANDDESLLILYSAKVNFYAEYSESLQLLSMGESLLEIDQQINDPRYKALAYYALAIGHYNAADNPTALAYLTKFSMTLTETKSINDSILFHVFMSYLNLHANNLEGARIQISEILTLNKSLNQDTWLTDNSRLHANLLSLLLDAKKGASYEEVWSKYEQFRTKALQTPLGPENWTLILYEYGGLIQDHYQRYPQAITYYQSYLKYCEQIIYLKDLPSPNYHIKLLLAMDFYRTAQYQEASKLYNAIYTETLDAESSIKYNQLIARIKTLSEQELVNQIDLLNAVRESDEKRIKAQQSTIILLISIFAILAVGAILLYVQYGRMRKLKNTIFEQSITDFLTQVSTRAHVFQMLNTLDLASINYCIALLDIDNFKQINDQYGHVVGDDVLKQVAQTIKSSIRESDTVGRYGGEEFICVIHTTDDAIISQVTERIRNSVESISWPYANLQTTISIGAIIHPGQCFPESIEEADRLLYEAKHSGKNRVIFKTHR